MTGDVPDYAQMREAIEALQDSGCGCIELSEHLEELRESERERGGGE